MKDMYVTVTGFDFYYGIKPFVIGTKLECEKEPDNVHDTDAIKVIFPVLGTIGYIANSVHTRANGTLSAGRIYEKVGDKFSIEVMFSTSNAVIARVISEAKTSDDLYVNGARI